MGKWLLLILLQPQPSYRPSGGHSKLALISKGKQGLCHACTLLWEDQQGQVISRKSTNHFLKCQTKSLCDLTRTEEHQNLSAFLSVCEGHRFWPAFSNTNIILCAYCKNTQKEVLHCPFIPCWEGTNWTNKWHMLVILLHTLLECVQILWCLLLRLL